MGKERDTTHLGLSVLYDLSSDTAKTDNAAYPHLQDCPTCQADLKWIMSFLDHAKRERRADPPEWAVSDVIGIFKRFKGPQERTMLRTISLSHDGKAELQVINNGDHSITITRLWIWSDEKGGHGVGADALSGHILTLERYARKRIDVTMGVLNAVDVTDGVGLYVWVAFQLDPDPAGDPAPALYEADIHGRKIVRFVAALH